MTEKLKQAIARVLPNTSKGCYRCLLSTCDNCDAFDSLFGKMLQAMKEAGLVQLDENQELPENPYPKSVFPLETDEAAKLIPASRRDGISGALGRHFYNLAQEDMWDFKRVKEIK